MMCNYVVLEIVIGISHLFYWLVSIHQPLISFSDDRC